MIQYNAGAPIDPQPYSAEGKPPPKQAWTGHPAVLRLRSASPNGWLTLLVSRSTMKLEFEWHDAKAAANLRAHGVSFDLAKTTFSDPFAIERLDDRADYGEERFVMIGMAEGNVLLFVAYTEREECIRIISARRATQYEQEDYFKKNA